MDKHQNDSALYLLPTIQTFVELDSKSIVIKQNKHTVQRFPLRRLKFICTNQHTNWQTNALISLMENGISLHFIGKENKTLGKLIPHKLKHQPDIHWIDRLVNHPNRQEKLENYLLNRVRKLYNSKNYQPETPSPSYQLQFQKLNTVCLACVNQELANQNLLQERWEYRDLALSKIFIEIYQNHLHKSLQDWFKQIDNSQRTKENLIKFIDKTAQDTSITITHLELPNFISWIQEVLD